MEDSNIWIWIIVGGILLVLLISGGYLGFRNKEGKIEDRFLTVDRFLKELEKFKMHVNPKRKLGFTEKDVQDELMKFFRKHFETVQPEYALEGSNVKKIDFDLGKGKIGVEVKLARECIKEASWDRALGQLGKYAKKKYTDKNLIVLIAGTEEEKEDHRVKEFISDINDIECIDTYVTISAKETN